MAIKEADVFCSKKCGRMRRGEKQRYCLVCHAKYQKKFRKKLKEEIEKLRSENDSTKQPV